MKPVYASTSFNNYLLNDGSYSIHSPSPFLPVILNHIPGKHKIIIYYL